MRLDPEALGDEPCRVAVAPAEEADDAHRVAAEGTVDRPASVLAASTARSISSTGDSESSSPAAWCVT